MSVKNNTILIVEDDVTVSSALNEYLTAWDFEVVHIAQDGQNALEAYDATKPQFVIVDGHLGGAINCTELVSEIHKKGPVVILYSVNNVEDAFQNEQNYVYATGFIQKPINKFLLKLAIQSAKSSLQHWNTKISKVEQDLNMANLQIEELTVTNEHLITATFRERALKKEN
jgi:DNA-binding NtrC family response regulator